MFEDIAELGVWLFGMKAYELMDSNCKLKQQQISYAQMQNENLMLRNQLAHIEAQRTIEVQPTTTWEELEAEYQRSLGN